MALQLASLAIPVPTVRARAPKPPVPLATTAMVMFKHPVLPAPTWQQQSLSPLMSHVLPVPKDQDATAQTKRKIVILVFTALLEVKPRDQTTFPLKKEACVYLATTVTQEASNKLHAVTAITAPTMPLKPKLAHAGQAFTASQTRLFRIKTSAPPANIALAMANRSSVQSALTVCQQVPQVALTVIPAPLVLSVLRQD